VRGALPRYRLLRLLRQNQDVGVYDAWSEERTCRCIAKVLRGGRFDTMRGRRELRREARLLLSLTHPHIVRGYELVERPRLALIMETLPGETLTHVLRSQFRLHQRDLALLGRQVCSALQYLHGRGVLHLDVKPSNVIVHGGIARVLDLGLARPPGHAEPGIGTDPYMPPEQVRGGRLGPAADVFALGTVLFEAATGKRAFDSDGSRRRWRQLESRAPRVRTLRRLPASMAEVIDACLEPEPSRRPPMAAVAAALQATP
jgi:serine/threonine protein kinase